MSDFKIEFLDHVAIRVKDLELSSNWYIKTLGLKRYHLAEWGKYPIFLLSGKSGLALFPATLSDEKISATSKNIKIDHFAFNLTNENFIKAQNRFKNLDIDFEFQDHFYFHSIYAKDPDGHVVELTTLVVDQKEFYK
jgi:catechol 2,3-dioxygenase-like lactoylglutathione lyase family enzyme